MLLAMIPHGDLPQVTLEQFRREAAGQHPLPAGVAIAAVSAGFALGLVAKVLTVVGRRATPPADAARLEPLTAAAGLKLCSEASAFTPADLTADLGVSADLLASALRGFLLCARSNVGQLAPAAASLSERVATETEGHATALRLAETILGHARRAVGV